MALHIGIVGCSAEGAALCFRTICEEGSRLLGLHRHPEISVHMPSLHRYLDCLDQGDLAGVAALMLDSADKLAGSGADFLICPDNTIHQAMHLVQPHSPLPWLSIADVVAQTAAARGLRRVGVMGTSWLVQSTVYPLALSGQGVSWMRPNEEDINDMHAVIMHDLVPVEIKENTISRLTSVAWHLRDAGCDGVVLGCTELPLVLNEANLKMPALDSTRLLAQAALRRATA